MSCVFAQGVKCLLVMNNVCDLVGQPSYVMTTHGGNDANRCNKHL